MRENLVVMFFLVALVVPGPVSSETGDERVLHTPVELDGFDIRFLDAALPAVGEVATVSVAVTPQWYDLRAGVVDLVLPSEVEAVGPTSAQVFFIEGLPAIAEFSLRLVAPGQHQLRAEANGVNERGHIAWGRGVAYVEAPDVGAASLYPNGLPFKPGPYRAVQIAPDVPADWDPHGYVSPPEAGEAGGLQPAASPSPTPGGVSTMGHSTFQVTACWNFRAYSNSADWQNQRWAQVDVMDDDPTDDDVLWNGFTDSNGCFTTGSISRAEECCFSGNQDVYIKFIMENSHVIVDSPGALGRYEFLTDVRTVTSQDLWSWGEWTTAESHIAARQFQYANNAWDYGDNTAAASIPWKVELETPETCIGGGTGACYWPTTDTIYIPDGRDGLPEVTAHEYAHFVMDKFYGVFDGGTGGDHSLCEDNQDRGLSWSEGFATYYGVSTNYKLYPINGTEGNTYWKTSDLEWYDCNVTGDDNEWNVARTMWDLEDSNNDGESLDYSPFALLDIVDDCDHNNFREYYDLAACSWVQHGYSSANFKTSANKNDIPY